ncbi:MAG: TIGR00730 family Rossman fold protein [Ilumatobacteraceae bacterium]
MPPRRLCLYCGSRAGTRPEFAAAAADFGTRLAERGIGLVYGGGSVGLMGIAADAALAAGGEVIGVITEQLRAAEVAHDGLTVLEVVGSMHERKARMNEIASAVVALPGGFGTVDEFAEMLTWNQLGLVVKPVVLLDVLGFWRPFLDWVDLATDLGFVHGEHRALACRAATVDEAIDSALAPFAPPSPKWVEDRVAPPR